jgi:hypothetical protein
MSPEQVGEALAIVTPSYGPDLDLCRELNESIQMFAPGSTHYILVDRRDMRAFAPLAGHRTVVLDRQEVLPRSFRRIPGTNRWVNPYALRPLSGWLMQQIVKIACASALEESTLVMVDSDTCFVQPVTESTFVRDGRCRCYSAPGAITADMSRHLEWYATACALLGVSGGPPPLPDSICSLASWDRRTVLDMCARVEEVTGRDWYASVARHPQFSEFLLYGVYVSLVPDGGERTWLDDRSRCLTYWDMTPLTSESAQQLVRGFQPGDLAVLISSHSGTAPGVRTFVRQEVSGEPGG